MPRLGYVKPVRHDCKFSPLHHVVNVEIKHSELSDIIYPVNEEGTRLEDSVKMLLNPNVDPKVKEVIRNNVALSLGDDGSPITDNMDFAEKIAFDPALQVGEEVDICATSLENYANEQVKILNGSNNGNSTSENS